MVLLCKGEKDGERSRFEHHDYLELLNEDTGCVNGCRTGVLWYRQKQYIQGGVHDDQEGFYVLEGHGRALVGDNEFAISQGDCFIAPAGQEHYICADADCEYVKLFFFHAASV